MRADGARTGRTSSQADGRTGGRRGEWRRTGGQADGWTGGRADESGRGAD